MAARNLTAITYQNLWIFVRYSEGNGIQKWLDILSLLFYLWGGTQNRW